MGSNQVGNDHSISDMSLKYFVELLKKHEKCQGTKHPKVVVDATTLSTFFQSKEMNN
jgi:hypothetical protein